MGAKGMTLYKVTAPDGTPIHGGSGAWPLPSVDRLGRHRRGRWRAVPDGPPLDPCAFGLHLTDAEHLLGWIPRHSQFSVWEAETSDAAAIDAGDKIVVRRARLVRLVGTIGPERVKDWEGYRRVRAPAPGAGLFADFEDHLEKMEAARLAAAAREEELAETDALRAAARGRRIVFGKHRLPADQAVCQAWPTGQQWERTMRARTDALTRSILGVTRAMERLAAHSPEMASMVFGVKR